MEVFKDKSKMLSYVALYFKKKSIGFVPTMGALHDGHLHLVKQAKEKCDIVICSIFINPTQFNEKTDFISYPRNEKADLKQLENIDCNIVYTPHTNDLYDNEEEVKEFNFGELTSIMEGKFRPGHFNGMATVVEKFLNIIRPEKAFFGQKDLQQLQVVKELVKQIRSKTEIIGVPTFRKDNGLAESSRNNLLSKSEKNTASIIYRCLNYCVKNRKKPISELKLHIEKEINCAKNINLEYVEFVDINTMMPIKKWKKRNKNAICIAAYINDVRLIDNIIL